MNGLNSCPLCKDFLKEKVQELGETAKQAILNLNPSTEVPAVSQDNENEGYDSGLDSPTKLQLQEKWSKMNLKIL